MSKSRVHLKTYITMDPLHKFYAKKHKLNISKEVRAALQERWFDRTENGKIEVYGINPNIHKLYRLLVSADKDMVEQEIVPMIENVILEFVKDTQKKLVQEIEDLKTCRN